jgi:hypothetical protein
MKECGLVPHHMTARQNLSSKDFGVTRGFFERGDPKKMKKGGKNRPFFISFSLVEPGRIELPTS